MDISLEDSPNPPSSSGSPFVVSHTGVGVSDRAHHGTSRSCKWPVEMFIRRGWNGWWCDTKIYTLPYVLMTGTFSNGVDLIIVWAIYFEICPIWLWIYTRNVKLDHRPILIMVVSLSPWSFRDMDTPARRKRMLARYGLIPVWCSFRMVMENRMAVIRTVGVAVTKGVLSVNIY